MRVSHVISVMAASATIVATAVGVSTLSHGVADSAIFGSIGSVSRPSTPLPQRPVTPTTPAEKAQQIATLNTALTNIETQLASGARNSQRYGDMDLRDLFSYHIDKLWQQGIDGSGTAVAVMEGWDDPNIQTTVDNLDAQIGLPDPTITTVMPDGPLPAQCPAGMVALGSFGSCDAWEGELTLDVEAVHMIAPYAQIIISATPSDSEVVGDPSSEVAMPEIIKGFEYVAQNKLANVMSVSDGSSETDYSRGANEITADNPGDLIAAAAGVPIANATGDCGAGQNLTTATRQCGAVSSGPASATWGDSPWLTAVGGVSPAHTVTPGSSTEDSFPLDPIEGAGLSEIYSRPAYQNGIARITGSTMRSVPDITMNSADGTSEAAPEFAGVLALATQIKGSNLGPINDALYGDLGPSGLRGGVVDVTQGNDTFDQGSIDVPGYTAGPGYDVASGWGTVDASKFAPALAQATRYNPMPEEAFAQLQPLVHALTLTPSHQFAPDATIDVTDSGLLPDHPVTLSIDGTVVKTITIDTSGNWSFSFTANQLGLAPGRHTLSASSLLLQQSTSFTVTQ